MNLSLIQALNANLIMNENPLAVNPQHHLPCKRTFTAYISLSFSSLPLSPSHINLPISSYTLHPNPSPATKMCEIYQVEYKCGCVNLKYKWTCKKHYVGSSMVKWPGIKEKKDQKCDFHGGPYDSENEYEYSK